MPNRLSREPNGMPAYIGVAGGRIEYVHTSILVSMVHCMLQRTVCRSDLFAETIPTHMSYHLITAHLLWIEVWRNDFSHTRLFLKNVSWREFNLTDLIKQAERGQAPATEIGRITAGVYRVFNTPIFLRWPWSMRERSISYHSSSYLEGQSEKQQRRPAAINSSRLMALWSSLSVWHSDWTLCAANFTTLTKQKVSEGVRKRGKKREDRIDARFTGAGDDIHSLLHA